MDLERLPMFAYGTMRDRDVLEAVLGARASVLRLTPAHLSDHRCVHVPDESYPMLVSQPGVEVDGDLIHGLGRGDWARIRFFESEEYELSACTVVDIGGERLDAALCGAAVEVCARSEPWDLDAWRERHKSRYLRDARAFMALFDKGTVAQAEALWARLGEDG